VPSLRPSLREALTMPGLVGIVVGLLLIGYLVLSILKPEKI
jgi:K+-transporting ATPase KdpF subunit